MGIRKIIAGLIIEAGGQIDNSFKLEDYHLYVNNEVHLKVAKSKPKGVSKNGTYKMYLDLEKYQYYMIDAFGRKIYANRNPLQKETVSNSFPTTTKVELQNKPDIVNGKELISFSEKMKNNDIPF